MKKATLRQYGEYFVFRVIVSLVEILPARACDRCATLLAGLIVRLPRKLIRYQVAAENIRRAAGQHLSDQQVRRLIVRMWRHLFLLVTEIIQQPRRLHLRTVCDQIDFRNKEQVVTAFLSGRPVILLSGHFGNWEMAASVFGHFGFSMGVIGRKLDNPLLDRWFTEFRRSTGHATVEKKGGYDDMLARLSNRGALALLVDQDAGPSGIFVNYFGHPASTHKSIALLALEYNALLCVGYALRKEDERLENGWPKFELGCETILDPLECRTDDPVRELTEAYTSALERVVRRAPEQYFWLHRRWKSVPRRRKSAAGPPAVTDEVTLRKAG